MLVDIFSFYLRLFFMSMAEPDPFPYEACPFRVEAAAGSDIGRERKNNEDRVLIADLASGVALSAGAEASSRSFGGDWLAAVCDGMGGEAGGEVASSLAVDVVLRSMMASRAHAGVAHAGDVLVAALRDAVQHASQAVFAQAQRVRGLARMGTTATVATLGDGELVIGQVGDSRAYLLRKDALVQLTRDQTLAALIAERTNRDPAEIVGTNVILQAVGAKPCVDVALTRIPVMSGDVLLLCSDGLFGPVADETIQALLGVPAAPSQICTSLIAAANDRGGPDNVSCVVARFRRP
jgi:serine/threonine protein phosphatase PrpC